MKIAKCIGVGLIGLILATSGISVLEHWQAWAIIGIAAVISSF